MTHYRTMEAHRYASLLEINLETGRTHQIRVHMAALRHPCVGDLTYGADPVLAGRLDLHRQWLHAVALSLDHPATGRRMTFRSEYPEDLQVALDRIAAQGLEDRLGSLGIVGAVHRSLDRIFQFAHVAGPVMLE